MKKITGLALAFALSLTPVAVAQPAQADTRMCTVQALIPQATLKGSIVGKGKMWCIGWGSTSRYEVRAVVQQRLGANGKYRWIDTAHYGSSVGSREGRWVTRLSPGRYRTRASAKIRNAKGIVIKEYGWDQSSAVNLPLG